MSGDRPVIVSKNNREHYEREDGKKFNGGSGNPQNPKGGGNNGHNNDKQHNQRPQEPTNAMADFYQKVSVFTFNGKAFYLKLQEYYDVTGRLIDLQRRPIPAGTEPAGFMYIDVDRNGMLAPFIAHRQKHHNVWNEINIKAEQFEADMNQLLELAAAIEENGGKMPRTRPSRTVRSNGEVVSLRQRVPGWLWGSMLFILVIALLAINALINSPI